MATGDITLQIDSVTALTITLGNLPAGEARVSAAVDNSTLKRPGALVYVECKNGGSPGTGTGISVHLLRRNANGEGDDGWDGTDSAFTGGFFNAPFLGGLGQSGSGGNSPKMTFDTKLLGELGDEWGIGIWNRTASNFSVTGTASFIDVQPYYHSIEQ